MSGAVAVQLDQLQHAATAGLPVDGHHDGTTAALLAPRSIAVLGGSSVPGLLALLTDNIAVSGFPGRVSVVEPDQVTGGMSTKRNASPDLAIVLGTGRNALDGLREAAAMGAGVVLLLGSGGTTQDRARLRVTAQAVAHQHRIRVLGPDSMGFLNTHPAVRLNASVADVPMRAGGLGLVARSGALGLALLARAGEHGLGVSQFVALGVATDICENDLLQTWMEDEHTRVIGLVVDSLVDPRRFATIVSGAAADKPVLAFVPPDRFRRSPGVSGFTAAAAVRAVMRGCGVHVCDTAQELIETAASFEAAASFATQPGSPSTWLATSTNHDLPTRSWRGAAAVVLRGLRDPVYGPLVRVGRVNDSMVDVEVGLAPLSDAGALDLMKRTERMRMLGGLDRFPPLFRPRLQDELSRVGDLLCDHPEIAEVEITYVVTGLCSLRIDHVRLRR